MELPILDLANDQLLQTLKAARVREQEAIADVVLYLREVDSRKLYREAGYPSLFLFCTGELKYSESGAMRRITAARLLGTHPDLYGKLCSGELSLTALAELAKVLTPENKSELIPAVIGKPKLERQAVVAAYGGVTAPKRERVTVARVAEPAASVALPLFAAIPGPVAAQAGPAAHAGRAASEQFTVTLQVDRGFMELYERASALGGCMRMTELLRRALTEYVSRRAPEMRQERRLKRQERRGQQGQGARHDRNEQEDRASPGSKAPPLSKLPSRHVPAAVRDAVFLRDGCRCTYVSPGGNRCPERCGLELDHIEPYAIGGAHTPSNLRTRCRAHNLLYAEQVYGVAQIRANIAAASPGSIPDS